MSSGLHVFPSVTDAEIQLSTILPLVCRPQVPVLICTDLGAFGSLVVGFFRAGLFRGSECRSRASWHVVPGSQARPGSTNLSTCHPAWVLQLRWSDESCNELEATTDYSQRQFVNEAGEKCCLQPTCVVLQQLSTSATFRDHVPRQPFVKKESLQTPRNNLYLQEKLVREFCSLQKPSGSSNTDPDLWIQKDHHQALQVCGQ